MKYTEIIDYDIRYGSTKTLNDWSLLRSQRPKLPISPKETVASTTALDYVTSGNSPISLNFLDKRFISFLSGPDPTEFTSSFTQNYKGSNHIRAFRESGPYAEYLALNDTSAYTLSNNISSDSVKAALWRDIPLGIVLFGLGLLTFFGNAMVLHAVRTDRRLQTVSIISCFCEITKTKCFAIVN